ncbi:MAG: hypothetical protein CM1200mP4_0440 [Rhodospirillaceae bacterium]|nr:MAG: hypothetical protein CM1200mP4_0440 [Rhodospirillaceae bacterium]
MEFFFLPEDILPEDHSLGCWWAAFGLQKQKNTRWTIRVVLASTAYTILLDRTDIF